MHWILQLGLETSPAEETMVEVLQKNNIPYTLVTIVPFSHEIIPEPKITGKAVIYGGVGLKKIALERNWTPGIYLNKNFEFSAWIKNWGTEMLNYDSKVCTFGKVKRDWDLFFIRPFVTDKVFKGVCVSWEEFEEWRTEIDSGEVNQYYHGLSSSTKVSYASYKEIDTECRFFIVDGKIVTASYYRHKDTHKYISFYSPWYMKDMEQYVRDRLDEWLPHKAFVLDIAIIGNSFKIVEINAYNCSGLYECDVEKMVLALEEMEK